MTGNVEELGVRPKRGRRSFFVEKLGGVNGLKFLGKAEGEHGVGFEAKESGVGMVVDGALGPFGEGGSVPNMVPVSVSEEKGVGFYFFGFEKVEKSLGGINSEEMALEVEEVGVGGGETAGENEGIGHERGGIVSRLGVGEKRGLGWVVGEGKGG